MPVLGTKLHVPRARRPLVPRRRLTDQLAAPGASLPRLVLVCAPAGFGKTTLMAQWLAHQDTDGPDASRGGFAGRVAWRVRRPRTCRGGPPPRRGPRCPSRLRPALPRRGPALRQLLLATQAAAADASPALLDLVRLDASATDGDTHARAEPDPGSSPGPRSGLSSRELDVLRLLATDLSGPEIAARLFVSVNTLRTHTKHIFSKLDVSTRRAAVSRAHESGLL